MNTPHNTPERLRYQAKMALRISFRAGEARACVLLSDTNAKELRDVALNRMLRECDDALDRIIKRANSVHLRLSRKAERMEAETAHVAR